MTVSVTALAVAGDLTLRVLYLVESSATVITGSQVGKNGCTAIDERVRDIADRNPTLY